MGAFHFVALDIEGKKQRGVLEGDSERQVRQLLRDKNLFPVEIKSVKAPSEKGAKRFFARKRLSVKELALLTRQLATLLSAGLPVEEALKAVAEQSEDARIHSIVLAVRSRVVEGYSLAGSMKEFPSAFSNLYCATVAAGEKSGHLSAVLNRLADYTEQQNSMKQKVQSALIYPAIMTVVSLLIVGFLLTFVVPKMVDVFQNIGQELPSLTQILIGISDFIKSYLLYIIILIAALVAGSRYVIKHNVKIQKTFHHFLLKIPVLSRNIRIINTARFSRTFAILSQSGVPVLEAMAVSAELITIIPIREAVQLAASRVREGAAIHLALKQTQYFPVMSLYLIASGEATGQLEPMLERVADNQENEVKRFIDVSLTLFEPMMILVMGTVVLFIVLAIMLPIFSINELVN